METKNSEVRKIEIRYIEEHDLDRLSELFISVFNSAPWNESWEKSWALERLTILYNSYKFCGFLAVDDELIIGAAFSRLGSFMGELELEVVEMFVSGQHQRAGVGRSLVNELENFAIKNKMSALVLQTDKGTFAKDFYLVLGFKGHEENLLMSKSLKD